MTFHRVHYQVLYRKVYWPLWRDRVEGRALSEGKRTDAVQQQINFLLLLLAYLKAIDQRFHSIHPLAAFARYNYHHYWDRQLAPVTALLFVPLYLIDSPY